MICPACGETIDYESNGCCGECGWKPKEADPVSLREGSNDPERRTPDDASRFSPARFRAMGSRKRRKVRSQQLHTHTEERNKV